MQVAERLLSSIYIIMRGSTQLVSINGLRPREKVYYQHDPALMGNRDNAPVQVSFQTRIILLHTPLGDDGKRKLREMLGGKTRQYNEKTLIEYTRRSWGTSGVHHKGQATR